MKNNNITNFDYFDFVWQNSKMVVSLEVGGVYTTL